MTKPEPKPQTVQPPKSTGVTNMAWLQAVHQVGRQYTDSEIKDGWPSAIEPHRLACLQYPPGTAQSDFSTLLTADCERARLTCIAFERHDYALLPDGRRESIEVWTDYAIAAPDFAAWLTAQGIEPSTHIAAWFKACKVSAAPAKTAPKPAKTTSTRNDFLEPLVNAALRQVPDPKSPAAVFALLRSWAGEKQPRPPLIGVTADGCIQWRDSRDQPKELSPQALGKRLQRAAAQAAKSR